MSSRTVVTDYLEVIEQFNELRRHVVKARNLACEVSLNTSSADEYEYKLDDMALELDDSIKLLKQELGQALVNYVQCDGIDCVLAKGKTKHDKK